MQLTVLPDTYAVCRLAPGLDPARLPPPARFLSVTWSEAETTVVCTSAAAPPGVPCSDGWRVLVVAGPLDLDLTGVLASLTAPLAEAKVPVFPLATYDTDYVLVPGRDLRRAVAALTEAGHDVTAPDAG